jgi:hypothetical protein
VDGLILSDISDDQLIPAGVLLHHAKLNCPIDEERDLGSPGVGLQPIRRVRVFLEGSLILVRMKKDFGRICVKTLTIAMTFGAMLSASHHCT